MLIKEERLKLFQSNALDGLRKSYSPEKVVDSLEFKDSIKLVWRMLFEDYDNFEQSEFGVSLLFELQSSRREEWGKDWRNEALLGVACDSTYRYDNRFSSFKRAYELAKEVNEQEHPGLLICLARCCHVPGKRPISFEEALELALRSIKDKIYLDGAWALSGIYSSLGDEVNHHKWKALAQKNESENTEVSPHIYPQFLWDSEICPKNN